MTEIEEFKKDLTNKIIRLQILYLQHNARAEYNVCEKIKDLINKK